MDREKIWFFVNGRRCEVEVDPNLTLAECLRNELYLAGVRVSCGAGECGACTVLLDGNPVFSCITLAAEAEGKNITTIEGLAEGGKLHPIQEAFIENHGMQCGFCTPGMILSAKALLDRNLNPTEGEVKEAIAGNLCRCGSYPKIIKSILSAAKSMRGD